LPPRDLAELLLAEARGAQGIQERRQPRRVGQLRRHRRAVEVGAERERVDAGVLGDVGRVRGELLERRVGLSSSPSARTKPTWKFSPTTPPRSPTARSCSSVRLRGEAHSRCALACETTNGPVGELGDVPEPARVEVRAVDEDAELRAGRHQRPPVA
jgi:hypothetical protein